MKKACPCLRWKQIGKLQVGQGTIVLNGRTEISFSVDQRAWKCLACGREVWLEAGEDPNPVMLPARSAKTRKA